MKDNFPQLKPEYIQTLNTNTNIKVFFRLGHHDVETAKKLFAHYEDDDFQNLKRGEAIVRVGLKKDDVQIQTYPLIDNNAELVDVSSVVKSSMKISGIGMSQAEVTEVLKEQYSIKPKTESKDIIETKTETRIDQDKSEKVDYKSQVLGTNSNEKAIKVKSKDFVENLEKRTQLTEHRKIQEQIKKCGQDNGFISVIEAEVKGGKIDVSLVRWKEKIAVEISVTNTVEYEIKNIEKCLKAGYQTVLLVSIKEEHLKKIQQMLLSEKKSLSGIHFLKPEMALSYISSQNNNQTSPNFHIIKGYRVSVRYDKSNGKNSM